MHKLCCAAANLTLRCKSLAACCAVGQPRYSKAAGRRNRRLRLVAPIRCKFGASISGGVGPGAVLPWADQRKHTASPAHLLMAGPCEVGSAAWRYSPQSGASISLAAIWPKQGTSTTSYIKEMDQVIVFFAVGCLAAIVV